MKILYYDCFSGISGDMNLAAMIDLGVSPDTLEEELKKLGLEQEYSLEVSRARKMGISGTRVMVRLHHREEDHPHPHRHLADIEAIIDRSNLDAKVKALSLRIFRKIAEAEARVHGTDIHKVHFHEVGATDSIVDIVGAAICFEQLGVDEVWSLPPELGGGFVDCSHGRMPVPAPATAGLLQGVPVTSGRVPFETTTPTGAAILVSLVSRFTASPSFRILQTGYGVGQRDMEIPNVLRVYLAKTDEPATGSRMLECNIDDMNPEQYEYVMERLFEAGADDVYLTPLIMKKGRPAVKISVLCNQEIQDALKEILFRESTTLGIRSFHVDKDMLERKIRTLETPYGKVRFKEAYFRGEALRMKPEWEDCRRIATEQGLSIQAVYQLLLRLGNGPEKA